MTPPTSLAVTYDTFGDPDVLRVERRAVAEPGPGEVRLAVRAAGINPLDWKLRAGFLQGVIDVDLPAQPGQDLAGVVDAVGPDSGDLRPGDAVLGRADHGAYAELALVPADALTPKPAALDWDAAASLPTAVATAHVALDALRPEAGETLVVDAAAGNVGVVLCQLAVRAGVTVVGTASPPRHAFLRDLGVRPVAYGDGVAERIREASPDGVDAAVDAGHGALRDLVALAGGPERVVTIADPGAAEVGVRFLGAAPPQLGSLLAEPARLAAAGELEVVVAERRFALADAAEAHRAGEAGGVFGKLVLRP